MSIKSILGAFIFVILASCVAVIFFIQTESFGKIATRVLTDVSQKTLETKIGVKSISISLFPPGIELNQVHGKKQFSKDKIIEVEFGKLGFYLGFFELEERNLILGELRASDGFIKYIGPEDQEEIKELDKEIIDKIFEIPRNMPIRLDNLLIENSTFQYNQDFFEIKRVKVLTNNHFYRTRLHIANIRSSLNPNMPLDEIWGEADIYKTKVRIKSLKLQHDVQTFFVNGLIKNYSKLKGLEANLKGDFQLYLKNLESMMQLPEVLAVKKGMVASSYNLSLKEENITGSLEVKINELESGVVFADELTASLSINNKILNLDKLNLRYGSENLKLLNPVSIYKFSNRILLPEPIKASFTNFSIYNALRVLGPEFKILKGQLTGLVVFEYNNKDLFFTPQENFIVQNLKLSTDSDSDPFTILKIRKAKLDKTQFSLVQGIFQMRSHILLDKSNLNVEGTIGNGHILFNVPSSKIDLEDFGNISNLGIKGKGDISLGVSGTIDNTLINLKGFTEGFEILGYKLDKTEKDITLNLKESTVLINKMESQLGKTQLSGNGTVNYASEEIALGITSNQSNHQDLTQILQPLIEKIDFLPDDLDYNAKVDVDIFGKYNLKGLGLNSKVDFTDLNAYGETIDSGNFSIHLLNRQLSFKQLFAQKGAGNIFGDFIFDLSNDSFNLEYNWENLSFSNLNLKRKTGLNVESLISGKLTGGGPVSDYKLKLDTVLFNTKSSNYQFDDSEWRLIFYPKKISGEGYFFRDVLKSHFNLSLVKGLASEMNLAIKTDKLKPLLVAVFGQHLDIENFSGTLDFNAAATFNDNFSNLNLTANLSKLSFIHPEFNLEYSSLRPQFVVDNSTIRRWDLFIDNQDLFIKTQGSGEFGKKVSFSNQINLNAKILEILFSPLTSANGYIKNTLKIFGQGDEYKMSLASETSDVDLALDQLPVPINNLRYQLNYFDKRLFVNDFSVEFDKGSLSLKGDVFFNNLNPDVNLNFKIDRAEFPILGKSSINLSGEGIILGNNLPYSVNGEIGINSAQIINELNEFSTRSAGFSEVRYLPKSKDSTFDKFISLNLNVKADSPIRITNSLMDVAILGEVRLTGKPDRPKGEGRLFVPSNSSRIFFKNNEYQIISADINFNPKKEITNPEFDIQALTSISTYKVFPKAYGNLERFSFDLTSEPALPRNSILSLIAFGYTNEIQSTLYAKDQQSLTQVGVGSFVFDRFKISDILNKQFGLQVNLGTVIEQSNTDSLISGRNSSSGTGTVGRTRSATKIELKKRLDEALTLSVSSTMGGSIGQRQSMNLNYGLSKNVQIEGVYELRTNEEGQGDIIYNSIGGDLKFRRTFK
jgi:translocation and assembly module TamB